jgi:hypothetical protein
MTRRTMPSLLYSGPTSARWLRAAVGTASHDLSHVCRRQWQRAPVNPPAHLSARRTGALRPTDPAGL